MVVIDASPKTGGHASLNFENVRVLLCLSGGVFQIHNLDALKEGFQGICAPGQEKITMTVKSKSFLLMHN